MCDRLNNKVYYLHIPPFYNLAGRKGDNLTFLFQTPQHNPWDTPIVYRIAQQQSLRIKSEALSLNDSVIP